MNKRLILIAGPCVIESEEMCKQISSEMKAISQRLCLDYYFKASFDKANRTSIHSYRGPGMEEGLRILQKVKEQCGVRICTDIHEPWQAEAAAKVADVIQISAFLCRQTDLLTAAAKTGKTVNVKKGQFLAPWDMKQVTGKLEAAECKDIWLCERGTSFGYNRLIVDMTSIPEMQKLGYPVLFDATHSVQMPGGNGTSTDGNREHVPPLARAAAAVGADGFFFETHPEPERALSDGTNMIRLSDIGKLLEEVRRIHDVTTSRLG